MIKAKTKRKRIILTAAILAVAGLGVWYAVIAKSPAAKKTATTPTKQEVAKAAEADKLSKPTATTDASGDSTTSQATSTANFTVVVNRPVNNDTVPLAEGIEFRSIINGASNGSCTLDLTGPSGQKISKSANLLAQTSYSSCSIDVPSSQVTVGTWTLSFTAKSGGVTSSPVVQKVTVQ